jgi:uncharacterized coiled-coil DUF342 family protein
MAAKGTKDEKIAKDDYFTMMDSQIKKWDAEVDKLRAKGEHLSAEARGKYGEQLKAMRASRDTANRKLHEMRAASESAWQHMQAGVDTAWTSMKNALDKASSQFKK